MVARYDFYDQIVEVYDELSLSELQSRWEEHSAYASYGAVNLSAANHMQARMNHSASTYYVLNLKKSIKNNATWTSRRVYRSIVKVENYTLISSGSSIRFGLTANNSMHIDNNHSVYILYDGLTWSLYFEGVNTYVSSDALDVSIQPGDIVELVLYITEGASGVTFTVICNVNGVTVASLQKVRKTFSTYFDPTYKFGGGIQFFIQLQNGGDLSTNIDFELEEIRIGTA